ncbi:LADA_0C04808g1_1 [Lachancea dasiensis]|uniref:LADA_0C04808g1_1 n=1 Tax=Lachancea dasiensis TaxID=1072105 RepID=A0A1G4IYS8_9SACH|nr:LADA_0C04808g1_1 [Lachancea dasiensis]
MVKKKLNPLHIDYRRGIIENCLQQVTNNAGTDDPHLINVWTVDISCQNSRQFVEFIRMKVQDEDPTTFQHIKRIKKSKAEGFLTVIVCSTLMIDNEAEFLTLMECAPFSFHSTSRSSVVPAVGPSTKDLSLKWSNIYWPLVWRGNPNDQVLNDYVFDLPFIKRILSEISKQARNRIGERSGGLPVVSAFVNPKTKEVFYSSDARSSTSPLDHSIMRGITSVATLELERKSSPNARLQDETYLCLNFDVYTTHEPCSMCAMALIHSRIKRCIFLKRMENTGCLDCGSGDSYCMHSHRSLNSKYEVFRWLGEDYPVPQIDSNICC